MPDIVHRGKLFPTQRLEHRSDTSWPLDSVNLKSSDTPPAPSSLESASPEQTIVIQPLHIDILSCILRLVEDCCCNIRSVKFNIYLDIACLEFADPILLGALTSDPIADLYGRAKSYLAEDIADSAELVAQIAALHAQKPKTRSKKPLTPAAPNQICQLGPARITLQIYPNINGPGILPSHT